MDPEFHPYGTAVPSLRDCSSIPAGLQFHAYGTGVSCPGYWSFIPSGLESYPLGLESLPQESAGQPWIG